MVKDQNSRCSPKNRKMIFTCSEIESKEAQTSNSCSDVPDLKLLDPAIMEFSSKNVMARYKLDQLKALKDSKASQLTPVCQFDPRIIRLNILKFDDKNPAQYEQQLKTFTNLLENLSLNNSNPNLVEILNNLQKSLLEPQHHGGYYNGYDDQDSFNRHVSWSDRKQRFVSQQAANDHNNAFANITTTRPPRMGVESLRYQKSAQPNQIIRNTKGNSCSSERYANYQRDTSAGSLMNETKSSSNESMDRSNDGDVSRKTKESDRGSEGMEAEPEWFSWPASRTDFIDLHGFEDEKPVETKAASKIEREHSSSNKILFDDFVSYGQRQDGISNAELHGNQRHNNSHHYVNNHRSMYGPTQYSSHYQRGSSTKLPSMNITDSGKLPGNNIKNSFFVEWKDFQNENMNAKNWITAQNMMTISNIESSIKQSARPFWNLPSTANRSQGHQLSAPQSGPRFIHNAHNRFAYSNFQSLMMGASGSTNTFGMSMPTQEQLQQHTSQIMRNALNRKHSHEDKKFPK